MAEQYSPGANRIFYKSSGFKEGLEVWVSIHYPDLHEDQVILVELGEGIYYFDYNFEIVGMYVTVFYEDGNKCGIQVYNIKKEVRGDGRSSPGPNVINI